MLLETFPELGEIQGLRHGFVLRQAAAGEMSTDRQACLQRLEPYHRQAAENLGFPWAALATAEQVHGAEVARVDHLQGGVAPKAIPGADGLVTGKAGVLLGIYVADCAAVSIIDPKKKVAALLHSGRKGSELDITGKAIRLMGEAHGCDPADLLVHLSPCIRPPHYEVDIPALVRQSALDAGVGPSRYHDCGLCTASHPGRYYSYRREKGATGRMLALLGWAG